MASHLDRDIYENDIVTGREVALKLLMAMKRIYI